MSALAGMDFLLQVETTPGSNTFITVMNFNANSKRSENPQTKYPVFHNPVPLVSAAPNQQTFTVGGLEDLTDPGQGILRAAQRAQTPLRIRELWDGEMGEVQTVRVGGYTFEARPDALETITYDLTALDPAIPVSGPGSGLVYAPANPVVYGTPGAQYGAPPT